MGFIRDIGDAVGGPLLKRVGRAVSRVQESGTISADLLESDDAYLIVVDAPGATASDIQIRYKSGEVLVRIDRFRPYYEAFEMRYPGRPMSLNAQVALPGGTAVTPREATATLRDDGTVLIELPKRNAG